MAILEVAGHKCDRLLDTKIRNVTVESVQVDEIWTFVGCKQVNNINKDADLGDQYTFLGIDRASKLILSYTIGKRDYPTTLSFIQDLKERVNGRFQLTTDQFQAYVRAVYYTFYGEIDFAQQQKLFGPSHEGSSNMTARRYSPPECIGVRTKVHIGDPQWNRISTSHVERTNLSVRLFTRRFTRLTLGYSKKFANLKHAVALFIAHFNFCRVHSAHGKTPAMAAGITDRVWQIKDLLTEQNP
jgi:IS1 family transposase